MVHLASKSERIQRIPIYICMGIQVNIDNYKLSQVEYIVTYIIMILIVLKQYAQNEISYKITDMT